MSTPRTNLGDGAATNRGGTAATNRGGTAATNRGGTAATNRRGGAPTNLGALLRDLFRELTEHIHRRLAEHGHPEIRIAHGNVFQFLDDDGTRVSVLAERAQMTKQSMGELVAHLEAHGYVERVPDPTDGRAKLVRATAAGHGTYPVARAAIAEVEARWAERIGAARLAQLRELLEALQR